MSGPVQCVECGAKASSSKAKFCEYCGTELPPPALAPSPSTSLAERLERLAASDRYAEIAKRKPRAPISPGGGIIGAVAGGIFTVIAFGVFLLFGSVGGPLFAIIPLIVVVGGLVVVIKSAKAFSDYSGSPLAHFAASVVDERTAVSGGAGDTSTSTYYHATLEDADGYRREFNVTAAMAGQITRGDLGVAFTKGEYLLRFVRVRDF